ncbi:flagellar hook-length control protein FliK [Gemmata sp. G18]|uniref:Flagellar hook-length control protein FliK n=1 Tax=Gemmata palustris TaxID=2822762 RepID=A0ABS5C4G7_9BACT|nr:flagellar hook-length control protein FliK [Gemmata palustris]MBP3960894.1 flagellar hook-length control protein FliK [Gemmata palustris]
MASTVANVTTAFPLVQTSTTSTTTRQTSRTASSDPFQTVLAEATNDTRSAQAASDANKSAATAQAADAAAAQELADQDAADKDAADARAAELAGVLAATTQLTTPTDSTTDLAVTGALGAGQATAALNGTTGELAPPNVPTQTNPLFRQFVSEAAAQNNTRIATPVTRDTNTTNANAVPTPPVVPQTTATTTAPQVLDTTNLTSAVAAVQPTQKQIVVAQTPIVAGLLPNQTEVGATLVPTPVVAPQAPIETTALPGVQVGSRPSTAGEQFAAIASAASTLTTNAPAPTTATTPSPFATTLAATPVTTDTLTDTAAAKTVIPVATNAVATAAANALTANALTSTTATTAASATRVPTQLAELGELTKKESSFGDAAPSAAAAGGFAHVLTPQAPTAPQPTATVQTPAPVAQVADGIITHAHVIARGGKTEFQIRLDPPELGTVRIRLTSDGDGINGQVVVASDSVRRMIESQLPELRQRLEATGVTVQNLSVATDSGTGADTGSRGFRSDGPADFARQAPVATGPPPRPPTVRRPGVLDVMA